MGLSVVNTNDIKNVLESYLFFFLLYLQGMSSSRNKRSGATSSAPKSAKQAKRFGASTEANDKSIDTAAPTAANIKTVTSTVMNSLRQAGLLQNSVPTLNTESSNVDNETEISINYQYHRLHRRLISSLQYSINQCPQYVNKSSPALHNPSMAPPSSSSIFDKSRFVSSRVPLHTRVPQKKKEKIWANEYIDLSTLQEEDVEDISFNIRTGAVSSTTPSKHKFMTIEQWTDAFNVYASVRQVKYPEEAEGLSAYMGLVRRISDEKGSWYY